MNKVVDKRHLFFLLFFGIYALFFTLGGRSLENKDSVRFAEVSREILEFHDWVLLRLDGDIYPDKPPLHFWLTAGAYKLFGISPLVARLPEATAAFGGLLVAFFFAARIFRNSETAFLSAIMLLSAYGYFFWGRRTRIDIELGVFYSISLVFFYCGVETARNKHKALWYTGFWLATGCAFMSKGFVALTNLAVIIPYGVLIARQPTGPKIAPKILALTSPLFLLPVLPWVVPLLKHAQFSDYLDTYRRTTIMNRNKPFFTYFYDFPVKLFPASPFFFLGVWGFFRFRRQLPQRRGLTFMLLWVGVYVLLLHFTTGKTARYLFPIYLPACVVGAWAILHYLEKYPAFFGRTLRWADRIFLGAAILGLMIPFAFAYHSDVSMLKPVPYVICLSGALWLARRFLPLKAAGLFVSFIILLVSIEAADSVHNEKTSDWLRLSRSLKSQELAAGQVAFYKCQWESQAQSAVSFYYNKRIGCSDNLAELLNDDSINGIVARRASVERQTFWGLIKQRYQVLPCGKDLFIIVKPPLLPAPPGG